MNIYGFEIRSVSLEGCITPFVVVVVVFVSP